MMFTKTLQNSNFKLSKFNFLTFKLHRRLPKGKSKKVIGLMEGKSKKSNWINRR